jgi:hypothetical protein
VEHACNPSAQEAEAGGPRVLGQFGLYNETLPKKASQKEREREREENP